MKLFLNLIFSLILTTAGFAQDSILHRILLMGENEANEKIQQHAAGSVITGKTSVIYLDENIYLGAKMKTGSVEETAAHQAMQTQYHQMRARGAVVYLYQAIIRGTNKGPKA
jgi:hypothetical protein